MKPPTEPDPFLIDANLPVALAAAIQGLGHTTIHAHRISGERTPDMDIWRLAARAGQVIISRASRHE
jgi:predicted nuclease of predicted toxin-antitoxin system